MKITELNEMKENLHIFTREDLESACRTLIDALVLMRGSKMPEIKRDIKKQRGVDPNSQSELLKKDPDVFPECLEKNYKKIYLHVVKDYVYGRTTEYGTDKIRDRPLSHYVWAVYTGKFPEKGRRLLHMDKNTRNNKYSNLHPSDGVYN